ncbi:MAG: tRNA pseudouridine(38-40) synthase TruA [Clostridia bacterium]|nr:tRNA pseudouridine(38-40) synthase TruA [Clostridia bacterium]
MRNLLLTISYDGRPYHGWQIQHNADTVQAQLQRALAAIFGTAPPIKGCSRTDTGVHARRFCISMEVESGIPCERLVMALNAHLPDSIAAIDCREVPEDFHARYSSLGKRYCYHIWNSRRRNPFLCGLATHHAPPLDAESMHREGQALLGRHDFASFCASGSSVEDTVRTVSQFEVHREGDMVIVTISADGFLYNMVRIIVGTLLDIERGKLPHGCIPDIIASCDRSRAGITAPPDGVYLDEVFYALADTLQ